ncbi:MAG: hypothetical protein ABI910_16095 [Gemmatimonadota bacterium]
MESPRSNRRPPVVLARVIRAVAVGLALGACARGAMVTNAAPNMSPTPPSPDPRVGLKAGLHDAAEASWNLRLLSNSPSPQGFVGVTNSDLAFIGNYAIQGNYNGFIVWDISTPRKPTVKKTFLCPASQSDVSVYKNLLFVSAEGLTGRLDCGTQGVRDTVSHERVRGIRIFDATDISNPKYITNVQTCRGSHTHTVVSDPRDPANVYVYVSGSAGVRSPNELPGCSGLAPSDDANSALFRIEVIKVPLAHPEQAAIVSSPRIFNDLTAPPKHAEVLDSAARARAASRTPRPGSNIRNAGPTQCHDITVYPAIGLAGGACGGYGLLLDISNVANPVRVAAVADSNFSFWHSATFSNDGSKILFTDEWGGGTQPRCRSTDKMEWGADAIFTLVDRKMTFKSYYKMPAPQTAQENCVAHNGSLIPIPGREVMVQAWYQGGISVFDWTNPEKPYEIAYFDRGPVDSTKLASGGSWSVYWYNGTLVSSEIARGLDIYELVPSAHLSQHEIDAARTVHFDQLNAQEQPKLLWPASFSLARAYLDQLERNGGEPTDRIAAARADLTAAEKLSGSARRSALDALATRMHTEARSATDAPKAHMAAGAVGDLAKSM